jgi:hypothetical protein
MASLQSRPSTPPRFISDSELLLAPDYKGSGSGSEDESETVRPVRARDTPEIQALREALVEAALDVEARRPRGGVDDVCRLSRISGLRTDIAMLDMWPARGCTLPRVDELLETLRRICAQAVAPAEWAWLLEKFEDRKRDLREFYVS